MLAKWRMFPSPTACWLQVAVGGLRFSPRAHVCTRVPYYSALSLLDIQSGAVQPVMGLPPLNDHRQEIRYLRWVESLPSAPSYAIGRTNPLVFSTAFATGAEQR